MICYKDMTFCPFFKDCGVEGCDRCLTDEVREMADKWWGKGKDEAPISQFVSKPDCWEEK